MAIPNYATNLPDEILMLIFEGLGIKNTVEFRKVCRSWCLVASRSFMKDVYLQGAEKMESFMYCLDNNPSYAGYVHKLKIYIDSETSNPIVFTSLEHLMRLFSGYRFPNLTDLTLTGDYSITNPNFYPMVVKACPNVEKLNYGPNRYMTNLYNQLVGRYQPTLKYVKLNMRWLKSPSLSNFRQMEDVDISDPMNSGNCKALLPLFNNRFTLKLMTSVLAKSDKKNFMEDYLESKTEQEQHRILKKLSKLEILDMEMGTFCPESLEFISRYMTGLKELYIEPGECMLVKEEKMRAILKTYEDFLSRIPVFHMHMNSIKEPVLFDCVPSLCEKFFNHIPPNIQSVEKILYIKTITKPTRNVSMFINSKKFGNQLKRMLQMKCGHPAPILRLIQEKFSACNIDTLRLSYTPLPNNYFTVMLQQLLAPLPTVRKVIFTVPNKKASYPPNQDQKDNEQVIFPQVTHLDLHSLGAEIKLPYMWNNCIDMFPNIKYLKLKYFTGVCRGDKIGYQIFLPDVELERLSFDITPLMLKLREAWFGKKGFFVLEVQTKRLRQLYKLTLYDSNITKIDKETVDKFTAKEKELSRRIHISVADVEFITVFFFKGVLHPFYHPDENPKYLDYKPELVTEIKLQVV